MLRADFWALVLERNKWFTINWGDGVCQFRGERCYFQCLFAACPATCFNVFMHQEWNWKSQLHHAYSSCTLITAWAASATLNHMKMHFPKVHCVYSWHSSDVEKKAVYTIIFFNYFCHFTSHFDSGIVFFLSRKKKTNKTIVEVHYKEKWNVTNNYLNTPTGGTSLGTHIQTHLHRKTISVSSLKFRTFDEMCSCERISFWWCSWRAEREIITLVKALCLNDYCL